MIITITGYPGSGKSTLGKGLAKALGLEHYSAGDFWREIAKEKGLSPTELNRLAEKDKSIDKLVDERTVALGKKEDNFVMDSRLAWHFMPKSIKIFVKADLKKAAERVFRDMRPDEKEHCSLQKTYQNLLHRKSLEVERWKKVYGVDYLDKKNYDIIIDTTGSGIDETREMVLKEIKKLLRNGKAGGAFG
jgi:cytidylate kinase